MTRTVLITGANRGIGLELCRQLSARGDTVLAICRAGSKALAALPVRVIDEIDVTDDAAVRNLKARLAEQPLDWLVNNAGILDRNELGSLEFASMERQFQVNALGPLRVTQALLPNLGAGSIVGIVTSRMGSIEDNSSGSHYGYRMSKAAVNIAGKSLAVDLAIRGVAVALLHPGWVATDMTGGQGIPVGEAARGLIARLEGLDLENSGSFWHANGEELPW
jgi:NAD(P)-dependent dehydrogenase (short-subunit alcohol dehydrogenase family)